MTLQDGKSQGKRRSGQACSSVKLRGQVSPVSEGGIFLPPRTRRFCDTDEKWDCSLDVTELYKMKRYFTIPHSLARRATSQLKTQALILSSQILVFLRHGTASL